MNLHEMPEWILYELYDALDCLKTLDSEGAKLVYTELMKQHKDYVIDALQLVIIEAVSDRRYK